jgi:hypothetical protein
VCVGEEVRQGGELRRAPKFFHLDHRSVIQPHDLLQQIAGRVVGHRQTPSTGVPRPGQAAGS